MEKPGPVAAFLEVDAAPGLFNCQPASANNLLGFKAYGAQSRNWADGHIHCARKYRLTEKTPVFSIINKIFTLPSVQGFAHFNPGA